jgi:hypothetical protein
MNAPPIDIFLVSKSKTFLSPDGNIVLKTPLLLEFKRHLDK